MTPKFHWLLHYAQLLERFGLLLNCFVLERKHRVPKRYAESIKNTSKHPSASLLMEVISHHFSQLDRPCAFMFEPGLVGGRPATKKLRKLISEIFEIGDDDMVTIANESRFSALASCKVRDVVLVKDGESDSFRAGQVQLHFAVNDVAISIIALWELHHYDSEAAYAIWKKSDTAQFWAVGDILDVVVYQTLSNDMVGTIVPPEYK